jgi:hypothetical protein
LNNENENAALRNIEVKLLSRIDQPDFFCHNKDDQSTGTKQIKEPIAKLSSKCREGLNKRRQHIIRQHLGQRYIKRSSIPVFAYSET